MVDPMLMETATMRYHNPLREAELCRLAGWMSELGQQLGTRSKPVVSYDGV